jgi:hypothetical protein
MPQTTHYREMKSVKGFALETMRIRINEKRRKTLRLRRLGEWRITDLNR